MLLILYKKCPTKCSLSIDLLIGEQGIINTEHSRGVENYIEAVPTEIINDALSVLYEALNSNDLDKRFKAAVEILRFVK
ncbi:hypothetical protein ABIA69_000757 [Lysinibacillus parviboronicapiens]|uniref:Uncharacterized protein n=1 Tax=Lysinibacillus parviboronicapiens TaxID=436516 RepID=A0ABV2PFN3_9BACI